jgi:HD-like signal output (HDOD) protein
VRSPQREAAIFFPFQNQRLPMTSERSFAAVLQNYIESERFSLPVFSPVSLRVQRELVKREPHFRTVEKLISADQSLSSNILKVANSSLYRGLLPVNTVRGALVRLGISEVARIVFVDINKNLFSCRDSQIDAIMKKLWQHSLGCAFAAGMLSNRLDFGVMQHEAFSAGLFHDIGKLLILKVIAEKKRKNRELAVKDDLLLGAMDLLHAEQGCLLLRRINMPEMFAVIARDHDLPEFDPDNYLLVLVRMANHICHQMGIGLSHDPSLSLLRLPEAIQLRLGSSELERVHHFLTTTSGLFD